MLHKVGVSTVPLVTRVWTLGSPHGPAAMGHMHLKEQLQNVPPVLKVGLLNGHVLAFPIWHGILPLPYV